MNEKKLAGVVVLYNPTTNNISTIKEYANNLDVLFVVDNSIESNSNLFETFKNVEYKHFSENVGLASALNYACKEAFNNGYEWILTMDQDSDFNNQFSDYLEKFNSLDLNNVAIVSPWHKTKYDVVKSGNDILEVDYVMTSGNLVNLNILSQLNWFLDWLFIDGIDMEYCFRLKSMGYKIVQLNDIELVHELGESSKHKLLGKVFETTNHSAMRRYYITRNMHYLKDEYYNVDAEFFQINANFSKMAFKIIMFENDKFNKIKAIIKGKKDYKHGIKGCSW